MAYLSNTHPPQGTWFLAQLSLNELIYNRTYYSEYFDNCGNSEKFKHPVMLFIVEPENQGEDIYSLLKTEDGYTLIGIRTSRYSLEE